MHNAAGFCAFTAPFIHDVTACELTNKAQQEDQRHRATHRLNIKAISGLEIEWQPGHQAIEHKAVAYPSADQRKHIALLEVRFDISETVFFTVGGWAVCRGDMVQFRLVNTWVF